MKCVIGNFHDKFKLNTINTNDSETNISSAFVSAILY